MPAAEGRCPHRLTERFPARPCLSRAASSPTRVITHRESHSGSFSRAIPLPESVDPAKVTARYDKGMLTVELTKSPTSTSRKVTVLTDAS